MMAHCPTCTCPPESTGADKFCAAEVARGHETFGCLQPDDHDGKHGGVLAEWPPCTACDGLSSHAQRCPQIGDETDSVALLWWDDDGVIEPIQECVT